MHYNYGFKMYFKKKPLLTKCWKLTEKGGCFDEGKSTKISYYEHICDEGKYTDLNLQVMGWKKVAKYCRKFFTENIYNVLLEHITSIRKV